MSEQAIVDTSALIALEKISIVDVLCQIYSSIVLPEAVISEFGPPPIDCYSVEKVKSPMVRLLIRDLKHLVKAVTPNIFKLPTYFNLF